VNTENSYSSILLILNGFEKANINSIFFENNFDLILIKAQKLYFLNNILTYMENDNYLNINNISLFSNAINLYPSILVKSFLDINIYNFRLTKFQLENNNHEFDSIINIE
jgi:hypothetical protein